MKAKVIWMRNDGVVRVVHRYLGQERYELIVESKHRNALDEEVWNQQEFGRDDILEELALTLLKTPSPKDSGMAGKLAPTP